MQQTTNYDFNLIENSDKITDSLNGLNSNFTSLDTILQGLSGGITELSSPVRIWGLDDGAYKIPQNCVIYYNGSTSTSSTTILSTGYLFVTSYTNNDVVERKQFFVFHGNTSAGRIITNGSVTSSAGYYQNLQFSDILTSISNYVKNQLDYSTSNTTYALSAYQGHVLKGLIDSVNENYNTNVSSKLSFLTLKNSLNGEIQDFKMYGLASQNGTPSTSSPIAIDVVKGDNTLKVVGKNLFNKEDANVIDGYLADGGMLTTSIGNEKTLYIPCTHNTTYTVQKEKGTFFRVAEFANVPVGGASYISRVKDDTASSITFTTTTGNYLAVTFYRGIDTYTLNEVLNTIQIEISSNATKYEPYKSQTQLISLGNIELVKVSTTQDYIYKSGDKWYKHKAIEKISSYAGETISTSYISTTGELSTGATVYYILSTATEVEITDGTLKSQLEAILSLETYKEVTNITTTTTNLNPELEIVYYADNKVSSTSITTIWKGTQQQYDAITTKDSATLYLIEEA